MINDLLVLFSVIGASILFLAEIINRRVGRRLLKVGDPFFSMGVMGLLLGIVCDIGLRVADEFQSQSVSLWLELSQSTIELLYALSLGMIVATIVLRFMRPAGQRKTHRKTLSKQTPHPT